MKKTNLIITGLVFMNVVTIGGIGYMNKVNQENAAKYEKLYNTHSEKVSDYNYLSDRYESVTNKLEELEDQVYCVLEGENYDLTIDHDDATINYTKTGKGFIRDTSKTTIYSSVTMY